MNSIYLKLVLASALMVLTTGCQSQLFKDFIAGNPASFEKMNEDDDLPPDTTGDDLPPNTSTGDGTGGSPTGGSPTGGSPTGGSPTGGEPTGGSPTGGSPTGGEPTGGSPTGGSPTGGEPTGGSPTGGSPTGGEPTGGSPTGGSPTGGSPTGGDPTGGNPTGGDPTGGGPGMTAVLDTTLRYGMKNTSEGANILLHVGQDHMTGVVVFDLSNINVSAVNSARLVVVVDANKYGASSSGPSMNWNPRSDKNYVYAHRLVVSPTQEGNGRLRGIKGVDRRLPDLAQLLANFYGVDISELRDRGEGEGVTPNCITDTDIEDHNKDCGKGEKVVYFKDKKAVDKGASAKALHYNDMPDGAMVVFDLTNDVRNGVNGWALTEHEGGGAVRYYSKEGAAFRNNVLLAPRLVLE